MPPSPSHGYLSWPLINERSQELMQKLFAPVGKGGLALNLMRHTIGQSDLTPADIGAWSYDENGGNADPNLLAFNITINGRKMLKYLRWMRQINPNVILLGSIWSPPRWMKQNNNLQWQYVDAWVCSYQYAPYEQSGSKSGSKCKLMSPRCRIRSRRFCVGSW